MLPYTSTDLTPEGMAQQARFKRVNEQLRKQWKEKADEDMEHASTQAGEADESDVEGPSH